jgi:hypothetical protein
MLVEPVGVEPLCVGVAAGAVSVRQVTKIVAPLVAVLRLT